MKGLRKKEIMRGIKRGEEEEEERQGGKKKSLRRGVDMGWAARVGGGAWQEG